MKKGHQIEKVNFENNDLILSVDSKVYRFPLATISQKLLAANKIV